MADDGEALSHADFWDARYSKTDGEKPTHEWFRSYSDLEPFFQKKLFAAPGCQPDDGPLILHLGSGDSTIPAELDERGYHHQLCVDFSATAVAMMSERWKDRTGIEWREADVRNMDSLASQSVEVAFDKGTLDAMIHGSPWSPPPDVKDNTGRYLSEVHRVLKDDGMFLYVTYRQPHFIRPLFEASGVSWEMELEVLGGQGGSFDYYGWVVRKGKKDAEAAAASEKA